MAQDVTINCSKTVIRSKNCWKTVIRSTLRLQSLEGVWMYKGHTVCILRSRQRNTCTIQLSLVQADTSGGHFLSGLRRFRLIGVKLTWLHFRAVGICPRYRKFRLNGVRLNEGQLYIYLHMYLFTHYCIHMDIGNSMNYFWIERGIYADISLLICTSTIAHMLIYPSTDADISLFKYFDLRWYMLIYSIRWPQLFDWLTTWYDTSARIQCAYIYSDVFLELWGWTLPVCVLSDWSATNMRGWTILVSHCLTGLLQT